MKTDTVPMYRPFELDRKIDKSMSIVSYYFSHR